MFTSHKLKIEGDLLSKLKQCADTAGYATVDAFALHVLEKEVAKILPPGEDSSRSKEIVKKRLQGLGYIE